MNRFTIIILMVSIELLKTQGPRFGLKRNSINDIKTSTKHFNKCVSCADDKSMLLINTLLRKYHSLNLKSCNVSLSNMSEWCIQRFEVMLNKTDSVCKIYSVECECLKSCYRIK